MKRLLDTPDLDPNYERLAELFGAVPRTKVDEVRRQRVRTQLNAIVGLRASRFSSGIRWTIIGGSLVVGTAAAAMVGQRISVHWTPPPEVEESRTYQAQIPLPGAATPVRSTEPVTPSGVELRNRPELPPVGAESKSATRGSVNASEDPSLVAAAIQALRNQHDPAKARLFLNQYLRSHPRGALVEEALILSIEAASAMKDPAAKRQGCRYLTVYPSGRHRALAARACGKSSEAP